MNDFLEAPTAQDAPKQTSSVPWTARVEYKSGKTPQGFAAAALPEQVNAGFSYYDKEAKQRVFLGAFTATIIAMTSGVQGTVPDGDRYINYWSNLVFDTRDQLIEVSRSGDPVVKVATGIYNQMKEDLPDGVGYCKVAICYIHETMQFASFNLTSALEHSIKEAIGTATGKKAGQINLFNLFELSTRFWAFRFGSTFQKRTKDGYIWQDKGDMFFYPVLTAGIVTAEKFDFLPSLRSDVDTYVEGYQHKLNRAIPDGSQAPISALPRSLQASPTAPPANGFESLVEPMGAITDLGVGEGETDSLPF